MKSKYLSININSKGNQKARIYIKENKKKKV